MFWQHRKQKLWHVELEHLQCLQTVFELLSKTAADKQLERVDCNLCCCCTSVVAQASLLCLYATSCCCCCYCCSAQAWPSLFSSDKLKKQFKLIQKPNPRERERERRGKFRFVRRSKLISSTNLRRLPLGWQRCRRWQQLLICNASDAAAKSLPAAPHIPPPLGTLSIPARQHESPKCLAHNFCVWFCFVFLIKSTRRHSPLFSLSAFSSAVFSLLASSSDPSSNSSSWHFRLLRCQMRKSGN